MFEKIRAELEHLGLTVERSLDRPRKHLVVRLGVDCFADLYLHNGKPVRAIWSRYGSKELYTDMKRRLKIP